MNKKIVLLVVVLLLLSGSVFAQLKLPENLQKLKAFEKERAAFYLKNMSFLLAFLAGILSILSPCTLALVPAFFGVALKERKNLSRATLLFFAGFTAVFVTLGLLAALVGKVSITDLQLSISLLVRTAGALLVLFGVLAILGKGFSGFAVKKRFRGDPFGTFLFGVLFAVGWSACIGPILSGILLIAAVLGNYLYAGFLLFFYSLGLAVPIFVMAFLFDKYDVSKNRWVKGKEFVVGNLKIHSTNLVAGLLLILFGIVFLIYSGTTIINALDLLGKAAVVVLLLLLAGFVYRKTNRTVSNQSRKWLLLLYFSIAVLLYVFLIDKDLYGFINLRTITYAERLQRMLMQSPTLFNIVGVVVLALFVTFLFVFSRRSRSRRDKR
jgi:cytochrome c biogenesis protein CcdA